MYPSIFPLILTLACQFHAAEGGGSAPSAGEALKWLFFAATLLSILGVILCCIRYCIVTKKAVRNEAREDNQDFQNDDDANLAGACAPTQEQ